MLGPHSFGFSPVASCIILTSVLASARLAASGMAAMKPDTLAEVALVLFSLPLALALALAFFFSAMIEALHDRARGLCRIGGAGDGPADDQDVGAGARGLYRRHHPALVGKIGTRTTDAGHDDEEIRTQGPTHRGDLARRAHHAVEAAALRQPGQAHDLIRRGAELADRLEVLVVEAGEHGHRDQLDGRIDRGRRLARGA